VPILWNTKSTFRTRILDGAPEAPPTRLTGIMLFEKGPNLKRISQRPIASSKRRVLDQSTQTRLAPAPCGAVAQGRAEAASSYGAAR
jgi:hypothetical protein